jgi:predicted NAD/FAD-dependent oxidoreductase
MSENEQRRKSAGSTTSSSDDEGWELELENSIESNTDDQVLVTRISPSLSHALETENKLLKEQKGLCFVSFEIKIQGIKIKEYLNVRNRR